MFSSACTSFWAIAVITLVLPSVGVTNATAELPERYRETARENAGGVERQPAGYPHARTDADSGQNKPIQDPADLLRAQRALETAVAAEPANNEYAATLGYVHLRQRNYAQAARLFESVLARDPNYDGLDGELGFLYSALGDNAEARLHLRNAIAAATYAAGMTQSHESKIASAQTLHALRAELSALSNRVTVESYHAFPPAYALDDGTRGAPATGYAPAQGGVDVAFQPPGLGLRDERVFQLTGRVLWQTAQESRDIDRQSLQGGVGARYKPLRAHDLYVGGERRFKIGERARSDWLARAHYSSAAGLLLPPAMEHGRYRWRYADLAYALSGSAWRSYYGELREGVTFAVTESLMLSPYGVINARGVAERGLGEDVFEAGIGVTLRSYFGGTHYEAPNGQFEINAQYKASLTDNASGWTTMIGLRF